MRKIKEEWRKIPGLKGYEASNFGRIKSCRRKVRFVSKCGRESFRLKKEKILKPGPHRGGYLLLRTSSKALTVHSLVAAAFIGPRPKGFDVCHNNGKRNDNRATNLRYATRKDNFLDRVKHGTIYQGATQAKLVKSEILKIRTAKNLSNGKLAKRFKVAPETIRRLRKGISWRHI